MINVSILIPISFVSLLLYQNNGTKNSSYDKTIDRKLFVPKDQMLFVLVSVDSKVHLNNQNIRINTVAGRNDCCIVYDR